jgi:hypothetical protein
MNKENVRHIMQHDSVIKSEIMSFAEKWIKLEIIMLSEISQTEEDEYRVFSLSFSKKEK